MRHATLVAALALAGPAAAQDFIPLRLMAPPLALDLAQAVLRDCRARGHQVAVAVVDRFGVPQVMLRDALAGPHTPETAVAKARTAVSFRAATEQLSEAAAAGRLSTALRHIPGTMFVGGGVPVEAAGAIVGAVGVSGGPSGAADDACARAGLAAVEERLQM